jgi:hypothetical protein
LARLTAQGNALSNTLYERDFYAWANEQAALLRAGKLGDADIGNIAEEIESMGRSEKRELESRFTVLLSHLLKWQFQPERRGKSWRVTIEQQRRQLAKHLRENPSLKSAVGETVLSAYEDARIEAEKETDLDREVFPLDCPYTLDQLMDLTFLPD